MSTRRVEVAVIGLGAAGAAALWRLAARGVACAGFEQFEPGHDRGSSHGESRIFRTAYFEGPGYVPLLQGALPLWRRLEEETGERLLALTGGLMIGPPGGRIAGGALASARAHGLRHEVLEGAELRRRFPQHAVDTGDVAVLDEDAGYLRPEAAVAAAARRAAELGAEVVAGTRVEAVEPGAPGVRIRTPAGEWRADRALLCAGAWNPRFAPGFPLTVERAVQAWYPVGDPAAFAPERFPVFIRDLGEARSCYGLPTTDGATIKVAGHAGGRPADPDALERETGPDDWRTAAGFVRERLRGVEPTPVRARACMYTDTPDGDFLIAALPGLPEALLVSACSGHGFKFMPVLGEVAAALATSETVPYDLAPFGPARLARVG